MLGAHHQFTYHDGDDINQMVALYAMDGLARYDPSKGPLENYLYRHCKNRISNARRDEVGCRSDSPCRTCYERALGTGPGHADGSTCPAFTAWWNRRQTRARLASPGELGAVLAEKWSMKAAPPADEEADGRDLVEVIAKRLPEEWKEDFATMLVGNTLKVPVYRRRAVQREVAKILADLGLDVTDLRTDGMGFLNQRQRTPRNSVGRLVADVPLPAQPSPRDQQVGGPGEDAEEPA